MIKNFCLTSHWVIFFLYHCVARFSKRQHARHKWFLTIYFSLTIFVLSIYKSTGKNLLRNFLKSVTWQLLVHSLINSIDKKGQHLDFQAPSTRPTTVFLRYCYYKRIACFSDFNGLFLYLAVTPFIQWALHSDVIVKLFFCVFGVMQFPH